MSEPGTSSSVIRGLGETPTRVSVIIDNPAYRPSGPSSNADVQSRHNSISETNLIPKEQKSRSWNDLHDSANQQADQNGNDSDGSGCYYFNMRRLKLKVSWQMSNDLFRANNC